MIFYSANYINSDNNFVIQNLNVEKINDSNLLSTFFILKNILQRGKPTYPSNFLLNQFTFTENFHDEYTPLISHNKPDWSEFTIKGNDQGYNPALEFYNELDLLFPEYPFIKNIIIPECNISRNEHDPFESITKSEKYFKNNQQVDFFIPQVSLVIEIDGSQHDDDVDVEIDKERDNFLEKNGVNVIRIKTRDWRKRNDTFQKSISDIKKLLKLSPFNSYFNNETNKNEIKLELVGIIRFQLYVLELLIRGKLSLADKIWNLNLHFDDIKFDPKIAIEDIFIWLEKLLFLRNLKLDKPKIKILEFKNINQLPSNKISISISVLNKYTEEYLKYSEKNIHLIRSCYLEKASSSEKIFSEIDYFNLSITDPIKYNFNKVNNNKLEANLLWLANNIFFNSHNIPSFNLGQFDIIKKILSKNNTIGILPTGSGKSLCFHLACILQPAMSMVVCPIISLMDDQEEELTNFGISRVASINSGKGQIEKEHKLSLLKNKRVLFSFISPERYLDPEFRKILDNNLGTKICYSIIDEAHCLSEWGHDFRTSYLILIDTIKKYCPNSVFVGLTATASYNVLTDIMISLEVKKENLIQPNEFSRKELNFHVIDSSSGKEENLMQILDKINSEENVFEIGKTGKYDKAGVIFTQKAKSYRTDLGCHDLSNRINSHFNINSTSYASTGPKDNLTFNKGDIQSKFKSNLCPLIVATKAFGMGVNKKNIHFTIHYGIPMSMESLYQEAGRAGRDKNYFKHNNANCYVLFSPEKDRDDTINQIFNLNTQKAEMEILSKGLKNDLKQNIYFLKGNTLQIDSEKRELTKMIQHIDKLKKENLVFDIELIKELVLTEKEKKEKNRNINEVQNRFEKNLFRLYTMGIVKDWSIYYRGRNKIYNIKKGQIEKESIKTNIYNYIKKFDFEFKFKEDETGQEIIETYLQWINKKFVYNRKTSLRNVYENCNKVVTNEIDGKKFKNIIESYFSNNDNFKALQQIIDTPDNIELWFNFFYEKDDRNRTFLNSSDYREIAIQRLNRIMESLNITPLNLISGLSRIATNEFKNIDGKNRLDQALTTIIEEYHKHKQEIIFNYCFKVLSTYDDNQKYLFCKSLLSVSNYKDEIFENLINNIPNKELESLWHKNITQRIKKINAQIHV
jgi:ATP-dependent DNA helicase RecQ